MPEDDQTQGSLASTIGSNILAKAKRENLVPNYIISGLAGLGCSPQEISTLTRIPQDKLPKDLISAGKAKLQHAIRRAQIKTALKGNPALLIWLGKTYLGQRDQPDAAPQHTNIVVTADLLSNLQRSYQSTLSDIRRTKAIDPVTPDKLLAPPYEVPRGTVSEASVEHFTPLSEPSIPESPLTTQDTDSELLTSDSLPITSHNTYSVQSRKSLSVNDACVDEETRPPGGPPPTQTPTPTPKRLTSLGLENLRKYAVGKEASRWSATLKRMKVTRGGSRKEQATNET